MSKLKESQKQKTKNDVAVINLPWPPASLSGHNTGHWRKKAPIVKTYRDEAYLMGLQLRPITLPDGDIKTKVTFTPPDRKSDRLNYPNRMKPYFDGLAEALGINDSRFAIPEYVCNEPDKANAGVRIEILTK